MTGHRPRWPWIVGGSVACGALVVTAGAMTVAALTAAPAPDAEPPITAMVEETTLTDEVRLTVQLTYGEPAPLPAAAGVITAVPTAGSVIERGQRIAEVDGAPVVLLHGARPFWRDLSVDSTDGEDVRQLEQNLADLGFAPGDIDARFDWRTREAVRRWETSLGVPRTGAFSQTRAVAVDAPSIRIDRVTARTGETGTSPAEYTTTTLHGTTRLTVAQAQRLRPGTPVRLVLPDGTETGGTIGGIDPGGRPTDDGVTSPSATVDLDDPAAVAGAGPVAVRAVVQDGDGQPVTLVVPATALLAVADGGYAVELLDAAGEIVRTPVTIGLAADARVQILRSGSDVDGGTGPVLRPGDAVVLAR